MPVPVRHKFSGFMLVVEKKSNDTQVNIIQIYKNIFKY